MATWRDYAGQLTFQGQDGYTHQRNIVELRVFSKMAQQYCDAVAAVVQANLDAHIAKTGTAVHGLGTASTHADTDFALAGHTHAAYVPYTGATGNVDLNNQTLSNVALLGVGRVGASYPLDPLLSSAANDADSIIARLGGGTDVTLGPVTVILGVHPSATAANRYGYISVGDNATWRNLVLAGAGGNVGIGKVPTTRLDVAGTVQGTALTVDNSATGNALVNILSKAGSQSLVVLKDGTTAKWWLGKNNDNHFGLYDYDKAGFALELVGNGALTLSPAGGVTISAPTTTNANGLASTGNGSGYGLGGTGGTTGNGGQLTGGSSSGAACKLISGTGTATPVSAILDLPNFSADPSGAATVGQVCVVGGKLKICTTAGTPGTWTVVGTQS